MLNSAPPCIIRLSPCVVVFPAASPSPILSDGIMGLPQKQSTAFGDGTHPTTQLCAGAVDFLCRQQTIENFLDVGTGTGVLARIARNRGARFVVGTDIELSILEIARGNSTLDSHSVDIIFDKVAPDHWGPRFNLVVANILEGPLVELAPVVAKSLVPGGVLLLSGFTRLQIPKLRVAYTDIGMHFVSEAFLQDWALLMFRRVLPT